MMSMSVRKSGVILATAAVVACSTPAAALRMDGPSRGQSGTNSVTVKEDKSAKCQPGKIFHRPRDVTPEGPDASAPYYELLRALPQGTYDVAKLHSKPEFDPTNLSYYLGSHNHPILDKKYSEYRTDGNGREVYVGQFDEKHKDARNKAKKETDPRRAKIDTLRPQLEELRRTQGYGSDAVRERQQEINQLEHEIRHYERIRDDEIRELQSARNWQRDGARGSNWYGFSDGLRQIRDAKGNLVDVPSTGYRYGGVDRSKIPPVFPPQNNPSNPDIRTTMVQRHSQLGHGNWWEIEKEIRLAEGARPWSKHIVTERYGTIANQLGGFGAEVDGRTVKVRNEKWWNWEIREDGKRVIRGTDTVVEEFRLLTSEEIRTKLMLRDPTTMSEQELNKLYRDLQYKRDAESLGFKRFFAKREQRKLDRKWNYGMSFVVNGSQFEGGSKNFGSDFVYIVQSQCIKLTWQGVSHVEDSDNDDTHARKTDTDMSDQRVEDRITRAQHSSRDKDRIREDDQSFACILATNANYNEFQFLQKHRWNGDIYDAEILFTLQCAASDEEGTVLYHSRKLRPHGVVEEDSVSRALDKPQEVAATAGQSLGSSFLSLFRHRPSSSSNAQAPAPVEVDPFVAASVSATTPWDVTNAFEIGEGKYDPPVTILPPTKKTFDVGDKVVLKFPVEVGGGYSSSTNTPEYYNAEAASIISTVGADSCMIELKNHPGRIFEVRYANLEQASVNFIIDDTVHDSRDVLVRAGFWADANPQEQAAKDASAKAVRDADKLREARKRTATDARLHSRSSIDSVGGELSLD